MRPKPSLFLFGVLLWILCTHSRSDGSIIKSTSFFVPSIHKSLQDTIRESTTSSRAEKLIGALTKGARFSVEFTAPNVGRNENHERILNWNDIYVSKDSPAYGQHIVDQADYEGNGQIVKANIAVAASQYLIYTICQGDPSRECAKYETQISFAGTDLHKFCKTPKKCKLVNYRPIDGSCNHVGNGTLGRSFTGYRRLIFPYYDDGINLVRRPVNYGRLPGARAISNRLNKHLDKKHDIITLAVMQWTQFVANDMARTASSNMLYSNLTVTCCDKDFYNLAPRYIHQFCMPIVIPHDDPYYSKYRATCMTYARSVLAFDPSCTFGPSDQMNQVTHYLDGSQIYGSTHSKSNALREKSGGRLKTSKDDHNLLPSSQHPEMDCQILKPTSRCYKAGDYRVNLQPHLTVMHVLWMREHNRIAKELQEMNPNWNDEKLFQEARKIVIAELQHITYNEWAPVLLGKHFLKKSRPNDFEENVEPTVSNAFATAAMRIDSSMMDNFLKVYDENRSSKNFLKLHEHYNRPAGLEKSGTLDGLIRGLATQSAQQVDINLVTDVSEKLYAMDRNPLGFDSLSLDIQRGRDHGLPGYLEYREVCNLPEIKEFSDLKHYMPSKIADIITDIYASPKDIDLMVGGLAETPADDALVGPTFRCIIAEQLERSRQGDRFFYTHSKNSWGFTTDQLNEIKKISLATIFCENGDHIKKMQSNVFHQISNHNPLKDCSEIPKLDLSHWKE